MLIKTYFNFVSNKTFYWKDVHPNHFCNLQDSQSWRVTGNEGNGWHETKLSGHITTVLCK